MSLVPSCQWELLFEVESPARAEGPGSHHCASDEEPAGPGPAAFLAGVSQHCSLTQSKPLQPLHYLSRGLSSTGQQSSVQLAVVGGQPRWWCFGAGISSGKRTAVFVDLPGRLHRPGVWALHGSYFCPCVTPTFSGDVPGSTHHNLPELLTVATGM